jgi:hypothetical protein
MYVVYGMFFNVLTLILLESIITNVINIHLPVCMFNFIDIYIFIPVSGCVGRGFHALL